jgi:hypothetical protein
MTLIEKSKELIQKFPRNAAVMWSAGKDSMVLLHLIRETLQRQIPVIYYKHPWFASKQNFANEIIESWGLTVHDYPPMTAGIKAKQGMLELVARYEFGEGSAMDLPINTLPPVSRRNFICGLNDWVLRPKAGAITFPWDTVYIGHKSSDVDPFDGPVPLKSYSTELGGVQLVFPLRDWSDADVWDYLEENRVPYDRRRYQDRRELPDKWLNPDYIHACTRCLDPAETAAEVFCPKAGRNVPNVSARVLRLEQIPNYIETAAA